MLFTLGNILPYIQLYAYIYNHTHLIYVNICRIIVAWRIHVQAMDQQPLLENQSIEFNVRSD